MTALGPQASLPAIPVAPAPGGKPAPGAAPTVPFAAIWECLVPGLAAALRQPQPVVTEAAAGAPSPELKASPEDAGRPGRASRPERAGTGASNGVPPPAMAAPFPPTQPPAIEPLGRGLASQQPLAAEEPATIADAPAAAPHDDRSNRVQPPDGWSERPSSGPFPQTPVDIFVTLVPPPPVSSSAAGRSLATALPGRYRDPAATGSPANAEAAPPAELAFRVHLKPLNTPASGTPAAQEKPAPFPSTPPDEAVPPVSGHAQNRAEKAAAEPHPRSQPASNASPAPLESAANPRPEPAAQRPPAAGEPDRPLAPRAGREADGIARLAARYAAPPPAQDSAVPQPEAGADEPASPAGGDVARQQPGRAAAARENRENGPETHSPEPAGTRAADAAASGSGPIAPHSSPFTEPRAAAASRQPAPPAEPAQAAARQPELPPEPARPPATARDISLEVNRGERRVEVRISERGGDVQVAVRTPDPRLAGELRQELPSLTTRLEQAGFRAEAWHGAGGPPAAMARHNVPEPATAAGSQPGMQSNRDGRERQNHPRQQRHKEDPAQTTPDRKQFAGLFTSMR